MVKFKESRQVLEYLREVGKTNTFRLASRLGIKRSEILDIIKELEENQAVEFKLGTVKFLKFPETEKDKESDMLYKNKLDNNLSLEILKEPLLMDELVNDIIDALYSDNYIGTEFKLKLIEEATKYKSFRKKIMEKLVDELDY